MFRHSFTVAMLLASLAISSASKAACYDILGCANRNDFARHFSDYLASVADGPNCEFLYQMRNEIYREHGYCFTTPRAISTLGNDGCRVRDISRLGLNAMERRNAATILRAERVKGCAE